MNEPAPLSSKCYFLLPCHSLDDFPIHLTDPLAENLLVTWTAAWHPRLVAHFAAAPELLTADEEPLQQSLLFVSQLSERFLGDSLLDDAREPSTVILHTQGISTREAVVAEALRSLDLEPDGDDPDFSNLAQDFFALAFAYLQVQIMTRQLRYSSNLNRASFDQLLVQAAQFYVGGDAEATRESLRPCFDMLMQERNAYYPGRPQIIDLVLLADTTLTTSLDVQLYCQHPLTMLMTGSIANLIKVRNPKAIERMIALLDEHRLSLIGGLQAETPDPLLSTETTIRQIGLALATFSEHFNFRPKIFARRQFGITAGLPAILEQNEFIGAMHVSLAGGQIPIGSSTNIRWNGIDGSHLQAHCGSPLNAMSASSLLGLGKMLGQQMDSTHTAVAFFAHWPGRYSQTFQDLINIQKYAPVLGHFVQAEDYFDSLYDPGYGDRFEVDEYRSPYLQNAVEDDQPNPISCVVDYWQAHYLLISCRALLVQAGLQVHWMRSRNNACGETDKCAELLRHLSEFKNRIASLEEKLDASMAHNNPAETEQVLNECQALRPSLAQDFVDLLCGCVLEPDTSSIANRTAGQSKWLVINTLNFRRRTIAHASISGKARKGDGPVLFADRQGDKPIAVLELNSSGATWISDGDSDGPKQLSSEPSMVEGLSLKNEFFEIQMDAKTGGIRTLSTYQKHQNLISQQLAIRIPDFKDSSDQGRAATSARYTQMVADKVEPIVLNRFSSAILSRGKLVDGDQVLAEFQQTVTVTRGISTAELEIEIVLPGDTEFPANDRPAKQFKHPHHYLCNRIAWRDEAGQLSTNFQEVHHSFSAEWIHATNFVQIEQGEQTLTLLTGGLPYHRRVSRRMLDSLLLVGGERRRKFRLALGVNLAYPMLSAASRLTPPVLVALNHSQKNLNHTGLIQDDWCFHFDRKNILVTWWEPEFGGELALEGVQIRCQETEGRSGELTITCLQPVTSASLVTCNGRFLRSLRHDSATPNQISYQFNSFENFQIRIRV